MRLFVALLTFTLGYAMSLVRNRWHAPTRGKVAAASEVRPDPPPKRPAQNAADYRPTPVQEPDLAYKLKEKEEIRRRVMSVLRKHRVYQFIYRKSARA